RIDWSAAMPAVSIAGSMITISLLLPLGTFGLLVIAVCAIASGHVAVAIYHRKKPGEHISEGMGASLGALSGTFAALSSIILFVGGVSATNSWDQVLDTVHQQIQETATRSSDPKFHELANQLQSRDASVTVMFAGLVLTFLAIVVVATLAGWLAARSLERNSRMRP